MHKPLNTDIIKKYLDDNGLSIKEFCRQCKISTSSFYRIMQDKNFRIISLFKIAKKLNIPIHKFFE